MGGISCKTVHAGKADYSVATCPKGYLVTGCGVNNVYRHWNARSAFEYIRPESNRCLQHGLRRWPAVLLCSLLQVNTAHQGNVLPTKGRLRLLGSRPGIRDILVTEPGAAGWLRGVRT